jgi:hypothetical protein
LSRRQSRLKRASVINVSQLLIIDKSILTEHVSIASADLVRELDIGLSFQRS